jgi:8-oxo-dGTP diphosphatase
MNSAVAAKGFIFYNNKLLLVKRRSNDVQMPGIWEVPGGRLEDGENPVSGLKREILEETGLDIEVIIPFNVNHFTRDDGQTITMLVYLCKALNETVTLSEEHPEYKWLTLENAKKEINEYFYSDIALLEKFELLKHL